jgi:hypothetical protein
VKRASTTKSSPARIWNTVSQTYEPKAELTSSNPTPPPHTSFELLLDLPRELRDKVYSFLLVSDNTLRTPKSDYGVLYKHIIDTEILCTNEQVYAESRDILIKKNAFLFESDRNIQYRFKVRRESTLCDAPKIKATCYLARGWTTYEFVEFLESRTTTPLRSLRICENYMLLPDMKQYKEQMKGLVHVKVQDEVVFAYNLNIDRYPWFWRMYERQVKRMPEFYKALHISLEDIRSKMLAK